MTPKLNVWRLQSEQRRGIRVLVLRDEHGILKRVGRTPQEQAELKRWYRKYNQTTKTENLPASKVLRRDIALIIKGLKQQGYACREMSFGIYRDPKTGKRQYRRVDVFKHTPWTRAGRGFVWHYFKEHPPKQNLEFYIFEGGKFRKVPITNID